MGMGEESSRLDGQEGSCPTALVGRRSWRLLNSLKQLDRSCRTLAPTGRSGQGSLCIPNQMAAKYSLLPVG